MSDKKMPTPEEIQKEFEGFVKERFGGAVQVFSHRSEPAAPDAQDANDVEDSTKKRQERIRFDLKPKEVNDYLDRFVIKQEEAKKALSIAVCDHYNHVRESMQSGDDAFEYMKQNVLILGPTGVGKSYLIRQIAKLIGVPFVKADATRFTETGYVGANADDLIRDLVSQADGDIELAQYGIIYLDEADKLASPANQVGGKDVSGRGVQFSLLKLMEETEVDLRAGNDMHSQMQAFMEFQKKGRLDRQVVNTRYILFILSGAFTGLEETIRKRRSEGEIGFGSEPKGTAEEQADHLQWASTKDFIDFGFEPEFIGRLPIRVSCQSLTKDDLYQVLKNSEGSIVKQYERAFRNYGLKALFTDDGLRAIADKAHSEKTGARALMTVCEKILRDYKFELPSSEVGEFTINEGVITHPEKELKRLLETPQCNHHRVLREEIRRFEAEFAMAHDMQVTFDDEASAMLIDRSSEEAGSVHRECAKLLQSYEHGLKLVQQNTGQTRFILDREVVENPHGVLERWIRESYRSHPAPTAGSGTERAPAPGLDA